MSGAAMKRRERDRPSVHSPVQAKTGLPARIFLQLAGAWLTVSSAKWCGPKPDYGTVDVGTKL
jgi:hypothetical protein